MWFYDQYGNLRSPEDGFTYEAKLNVPNSAYTPYKFNRKLLSVSGIP
jgi:hypothetical protein